MNRLSLMPPRDVRRRVVAGVLTVKPEEERAVKRLLPVHGYCVASKVYAISKLRSREATSFIACCRQIEQGQDAAQAAVRALIDDFDPEWVILCGIAGAIPAREFTLGDVILATGYYDLTVSASLADGRRTYDQRGSQLDPIVERVIEECGVREAELLEAMRLYMKTEDRPPVSVPIDEDAGALSGDSRWKTKVLDCLKWSFVEQPRTYPIFIPRPLITSNELMRNPVELQKHLETARQAAGIEMEFAGASRAANSGSCPLLCVRGISDIIGFERDHRWTEYACSAAAAFLRALLGGIVSYRRRTPRAVSRNRSAKIRVGPTIAAAMKMLLRAQSHRIRSTPLLRSVPGGESYSFLLGGVYVDPPVVPMKLPSRRRLTYTGWRQRKVRGLHKIAIAGVAGSGKSTLLAKMYLLEANREIKKPNGRRLPVHLDVSALKGKTLSNGSAIIRCLFKEEVGLPFALSESDLKRFRITYYCDGLDELGEEDSLKILSKLAQSDHVICGRRDPFYRLLAAHGPIMQYTEILELPVWEPGEVELLATRYLRKLGDDPKQAKAFTKRMKELQCITLAGTPLGATMLLGLWRRGRLRDDRGDWTQGRLLQEFLTEWCAVEYAREETLWESVEELRRALRMCALAFFGSRRSGSQRGVIGLAGTLQEAARLGGFSLRILGESEGLRALFRIRTGPRYDLLIEGFQHDLLGETLVAELIVDSLKSDASYLKQVLRVGVSFDVNRLARDLLDAQREALPQIEASLVEMYDSHSGMASDRDVAEENTLARDAAAYYLGRFGSNRLREWYWEVRNGTRREHPMVLGTIATGLILMNDEASEVDYLESLTGDTPDDIRTRAYHRAYYGDMLMKSADDCLTDIHQWGQDDWPRTREAVVRRLESRGQRDLVLRAFDLSVFRRFCETRGYWQWTERETRAVHRSCLEVSHLPEYKRVLARAARASTLASQRRMGRGKGTENELSTGSGTTRSNRRS